jgi:glutaminyl-peptide cyclotransferase
VHTTIPGRAPIATPVRPATWDPGIGVDLVFFDGEDYGRESELDYYLLGSKYFVRTMGAYRPRAMMLVDMVGDKDLHIPIEGNSQRAAPDLVKLVYDAAAELKVASFERIPGPGLYDDHMPFLRAGIPAIDLIDFVYPQWHTTQDLPEHCSPESLVDVTRVLLLSLQRLGEQKK